MIRSLRQRHRRIFTALAVILPAAFALGVAGRKPVPAVTSLSAALAPATNAFAATIWARNDLFSKNSIRAVLLRERSDAGRYAIQLFAPANFAKPDLLIYWIAASSELKERIPDDAMLIGAFNPASPLQLSDATVLRQGKLVLYSLADGEIVDASKPFSIQ